MLPAAGLRRWSPPFRLFGPIRRGGGAVGVGAIRIGLLGNGNVARAPATGWAATGHDVVMGSHRPKDGEDPGPAVVGLSEATRALTGCAPHSK
ncbi:NAD(P)-binding domain-containing protein [Streptomyces sp. NPDC056672]|uniref:NAD(P)-binding domain-containing protein n=1 Tax=Streptomyces sp. NPDC056672 TaxID=3345906 RepID=UPI0036A08139